MSTEAKFIAGLIVKAPHERAPEYVKAKISIKREELIEWLQAQDGEWINADVKVSQGGKWYAAVDEWKPGAREPQRQDRPQRGAQQGPAKNAPATPPADFDDDEIPF